MLLVVLPAVLLSAAVPREAWHLPSARGSAAARRAPRPSAGCGAPARFPRGAPTLHELEVVDPREPIGGIDRREFVLEVPSESAAPDDVPMPLLVFFHGQLGNAMGTARSFAYGEMGETSGFATVYPQGLADSEGLSFCGTGWNTGANGDSNTVRASDPRPAPRPRICM